MKVEPGQAGGPSQDTAHSQSNPNSSARTRDGCGEMLTPTAGSSLPQALCHVGLHMFLFHAQQSLYRETRRLGEVRQYTAGRDGSQHPTPAPWPKRGLPAMRGGLGSPVWGLQAAEATQAERGLLISREHARYGTHVSLCPMAGH